MEHYDKHYHFKNYVVISLATLNLGDCLSPQIIGTQLFCNNNLKIIIYVKIHKFLLSITKK